MLDFRFIPIFCERWNLIGQTNFFFFFFFPIPNERLSGHDYQLY